jgi:methionyl-tRNA formyltransferase
MSLSIIFAGTPEFAVPVLEALLQAGHHVDVVYTQPDRPAGRGQQVAMSAVKQCALRNGLPLHQPLNLRDPEAVDQLATRAADLMVVVAYGLLLPAQVLQLPKFGCINIHASLLPRWRGAAPIQRAILAGDSATGVSIMRMETGLDTGPVLLERSTPIGERESAGSLHDRLAQLGAAALLDALPGIADGSLLPRAQAQNGVTYAAKIRKEEAQVDWSRSALDIDRQVRAFNPWPVAETRWQGQQLRIWEAAPLASAHTAGAGTVLASSDSGIDVACGTDALRLTRIQLAGRKAMLAADFLRAHRLDSMVLGA